jgi:hypothetical protein
VKIICSTLFDITRTNVHARRNNLDSDIGDSNIVKSRGQQANFDTILQIISMRAQPENYSDPEKSMVHLSPIWGTSYRSKSKIPCWTFTFTVDNPEVFMEDNIELIRLFNDSRGVPMIIKLEEWPSLSGNLNTSPELKNIHFEISHD